MPEYVISNTGGDFTATGTWIGGVVPPSATSSDIIGATTSGPLRLNNLGSRNIGSLHLINYANTIGFTGSATTLNVYGPTFSLGPSTTFSGNIGTGTIDNQRLFLRGYAVNATQSVITSAVPIKNIFFAFSNGTNNQGPIALYDTLYIEGCSRVTFNTDLTNTSTNYLITGTNSRGIVEIDAKNITSGVVANTTMLSGSRNTNTKGHNIEIKIKSTGTAKNNWTEENYNDRFSVIPPGCIFTLESGTFSIETTIAMTFDTTFRYVGGTISTNRTATNTRPKSLIIKSSTNTNNPDFPARRSSQIIDMPGVVWDLVTLQYTDNNVNDFETIFTNSFNAKNFVIEPLHTSTANNTRKVRIVGTNSQVNLGNFILSGPNLVGGGAFTNGWWYISSNVEFQGGFTYSMKRFQARGPYLDDQNFWAATTDVYSNVYGTAGTASFVINENDNTSLWVNYQNINVSGSNKIYALGSASLTSTAGIELSLPTGGGTPSGGEFSFTYVS